MAGSLAGIGQVVSAYFARPVAFYHGDGIVGVGEQPRCFSRVFHPQARAVHWSPQSPIRTRYTCPSRAHRIASTRRFYLALGDAIHNFIRCSVKASRIVTDAIPSEWSIAGVKRSQ